MQNMSESSMDALVRDCVNRRVWAVVGASNDRFKFGNRIFRALRESGYRVYAVNPNVSQVEGEPAYPSLAALPERPEVVNFVVPPPVTEQVVEAAAALGLERLWFQPGAESQRAIDRCAELGLGCVHHDCILVRRRTWPKEPAEAPASD